MLFRSRKKIEVLEYHAHLCAQFVDVRLFGGYIDSVKKNTAAVWAFEEIKKQDNIKNYVYRNEENQICIPGRYIVRAIVEAGRSYHDPRSARKMSKDLVQAGVICEEILSPVLVAGKPVEDWEYLDQQRVVIQRNAITRTRPAFTKGWECEFTLTSLLPEYITPEFLRILVDEAGRIIGIGDFRPSHGRFVVSHWHVFTDKEDAA